MFSNRNDSIHECDLESERLTKIIVSYYNLLISNEQCPKIWANIVNIMLEKGKGPVTGKLRKV